MPDCSPRAKVRACIPGNGAAFKRASVPCVAVARISLRFIRASAVALALKKRDPPGGEPGRAGVTGAGGTGGGSADQALKNSDLSRCGRAAPLVIVLSGPASPLC